MWITEVMTRPSFITYPVRSNVKSVHCTFAVSVGVLACLDGYMNIAIEQTEEYVNGQLKNKYGDAFLRGNNGKSLSG